MESSGLQRDTAWAMSEENAEMVRRGYDAFDRRDLETIAEIVSDDFELDISAHPVPDFPNAGVGRDHMLRFFATYLSGFSEYEPDSDGAPSSEPERRGRRVAPRRSEVFGDATVERDLAHVWTIDGGRPVRLPSVHHARGGPRSRGLSE